MRLSVLLVCAVAFGGCSVDVGGVATTTGPAGTRAVSANAAVTTSEPVLLPDGECSATVALSPTTRATPSEIAPGITECELVRLKGTKPIDVLVGESGKGQRETQVMFSGPGGREIYLFTDNRLTRIVKPGQG